MLNEENSYFKIIVKDALSDLKHNGVAFVFFEEQVQAVKEKYKEELIVEDDDGFFKLIGTKTKKEERRGRKKNGN